MKNNLWIFMMCFAGFLFTESCQSEVTDVDVPQGEVAAIPVPAGYEVKPGVVQIKFKRNPAIRQRLATRSNTVYSGVESVDRVTKSLQASQLKRIFRPAGIFEEEHKAYGLDLWYRVEFDEGTDLKQVIADYSQSDDLECVEPLYVRKPEMPVAYRFTPGSFAAFSAGNAPFNDPRLPEQWHYDAGKDVGADSDANIGLYKAWAITGGAPNVVVAIMDQGVDYRHEDLKDNLWVNKGEIPGNGIDDDNNGFIDDVYGYNFGEDSPEIRAFEHGTHVAGTVAAVNNNGKGVCGVAGGTGKQDGAKLMLCQLCNAQGLIEDCPEAYAYSADNGALISQNSWGTNRPTVNKALEEGIRYFTEKAGRNNTARPNPDSPMAGGLVIFASGNDDSAFELYPGKDPLVVAVSATDFHNDKASYSNFGAYIDISAPGGEMRPVVGGKKELGILSTLPGNEYGYMDGTSMACPHVSGVAALIIAKFGGPGFTTEMLRERLLKGVRKFDHLDLQYKGRMGSGITNALLALRDNDHQAPEAVSNLSLKVENEVCMLEWEVTADPGDDIAEVYQVFYSQQPLTQESLAGLQPEVVPVGSRQLGETISYQLPQVDLTQDGWFGVVAVDVWGNQSLLSNVAVYSPIGADEVKIVNPVEDMLIISWGENFTGEKTIRWIDASSRVIAGHTFNVNGNRYEMSVKNIPPGKYLVEFSADSKHKSFNILKK